MTTTERFKDFFIITLATAVGAAAVFFFLMPSNLSIGSVPGLAIVLAYFLPLRVSTITLILNVILLILGAVLLGKEFGVKTVYVSLLFTALLALLEILFPENTSINQDPFLDMICYVFVISIEQAILFSRNASSGGLDIVAKILNKYFRTELGTAVTLAGMCVAVSSVFVYDAKTMILSVLGTYLNGLVIDHFIFGLNIKKRVCIVSEHEDEIRHFILDQLHSGATIYEAIGAYGGRTRREIVTIVDKSEYRALMNQIMKIDRDAFVTVYAVNEVYYKPKHLREKAIKK